jgi:hypothetical protein
MRLRMIFLWIGLFLILAVAAGLYTTRAGMALLASTDALIAHQVDPRIYYEPRAFETDTHQGILPHELSHLHMIQTMGGSPTRRVFRSGFRRGCPYLYRKVAAPNP